MTDLLLLYMLKKYVELYRNKASETAVNDCMHYRVGLMHITLMPSKISGIHFASKLIDA